MNLYLKEKIIQKERIIQNQIFNLILNQVQQSLSLILSMVLNQIQTQDLPSSLKIVISNAFVYSTCSLALVFRYGF